MSPCSDKTIWGPPITNPVLAEYILFRRLTLCLAPTKVCDQRCGYSMQQPLIFGCIVFLRTVSCLVNGGCVGDSARQRWKSNGYIMARSRSGIIQQAPVYYPR